MTFIQSGDIPADRGPTILSRRYCQGWNDALKNVLEHLESQIPIWRDGDISPEHLIKHIMGNVKALQVDPPSELFND
jgi:hypothetical protein